MYIPYFRGKQEELLAIHERSETIREDGEIVPLIEPVNERFADVMRNVGRYKEAGIDLVVIENPGVGDLEDDIRGIHDELFEAYSDYDGLEAGYIVSNETSLDNIRRSIDRNQSRGLVLVYRHDFPDRDELLDAVRTGNVTKHIFIESQTSEAYRNSFSDLTRILIRDGFERQRRNADYPDQSFFSEVHLHYRNRGFEGFGDFLIVGDHYFEGGGQAHAVAIHMVSVDEDGQLITKHFVSDRTETPQDVQGKYLEALDKLMAEGNRDDVLSSTEAYDEFQEHHEADRYRGLGYIKRLSMMHHLEVIAGQV